MTVKTKIIVVGGGAGGLELVTKLGCKLGRNDKAKITLVDQNKSHLWKPLLHKAAAGSLNDSIDALSYLVHARNYYFRFQLGSLVNIDRKNKMITLAALYSNEGNLLLPERQLSFDILILALGSISNDFSIVGVKEHCIFLDNFKQANYFYDKILNLFFSYSNGYRADNKINIAIVGGGATGVELSAELYNTIDQLTHYGLKKLNKKSLNITLIEAAERILPSLSVQISTIVHNELTRLGVHILTQTIVTGADINGFSTKSGDKISADLMVWVAGIKAPDFMRNIGGLETNKINQLIVKPTLQTTLDATIFAIGDCSSCPMKEAGFVPPRAQAAHQMATLCYRNILSLVEGKMLKEYTYKDHGSLISLSRFETIGNLTCNLLGSNIIIKGKIARIVYIVLYRMHQVALHGYIKTGLMMLLSTINNIVGHKLKLY